MYSPPGSSSLLAEVIDPNPIAVKPEMLLTDAIALMNASTSARKSCVLVQSGGVLVGILSERDIVKLTARGVTLAALRVDEVMSENLIVLRESDNCDLLGILNHFRTHHIRHLPVLKADGSTVGVVTQDRIRAYLQPTDLLKLRRVREVMSSEVVCAGLTTPLRAIAQLMDEHRISCVAIADSNARPIGILTERDIVQLQVLGVDFETTLAQTAMSTPLFCLHPDDSLLTARQEMKRLRVRRLVVAGSEGELAGILTQTNLLRSLDPTEMYGVIQVLQAKVSTLESVNDNLLRSRNRQLEAEMQERTAQLQKQAEKDRLLANLAHQIRQSLNVREILNIAALQVRQILKVERVLICSWEARWRIKIAVESVSDSQWSMLGQPIEATGLAERVASSPFQAQRECIQAIEDFKKCDANPTFTRFLAQFQSRAHLVVPILQGDRLWGFLLAHQCSQPRPWPQLEIDFLEQLANHLGIAVRQAELYQQAQTELRDRASAEIALKQLNEELESRVEQRTAQLQQANEALQQEVIERQQVEVTLQEQFKAVEAATDGIAILNSAGEYVYLNTAHLQLFGYNLTSELLGKPWQELYSPEEVQRFEREVFSQLQSQGYWQGEATAVRKDGSTFDEEVSLTLLDDERFICVCRDISDRKQAELALLKQSQALTNFSTSLKQLHRLNTTHYQQFETLFADYLQAGCEILRLETGIISKIEESSYCIRSVRSTIDGLAVDSVFDLKDTYCAAVLQEERTISYHCVGAMPSLRRHPVYQSLKLEAYIGTPIFVGDRIYGTLNFSSTQARVRPFETYELEIIELMAQSIGQFIAAHRLERDRTAAEAALRESQHFIERIAESTPNILYLYDLIEGRIVYVNRNVAQILGYTTSEIPAWETGLFSTLIHPQDIRKLLKQVQKFRQTKDGEILEVTYRIQHANGGWHWLMGRHTVFNRTELGQPKQILGTATDITQLKQTEEALRQANEQLQQQAIRDPLTGLFNRRYLEESLQREIHRACRQQNSVGIIMLDIDRFKGFNDSFGHEAGDFVLQRLSGFLQDNLRSSDIVCRYGGEEFTVILPDASLENTIARAEQLREGIKQLRLDYQGRSLGQITLSLGVSCFPHNGGTPKELLRNADKALYQAKMTGRDCAVIFDAKPELTLKTPPGNAVESSAKLTP